MLNNLLMQCGHPATCIMEKVPIGNGVLASVAACDQCFNHSGDANQKACAIKEKRQYREVYSENYKLYLVALLSFAILSTVYILFK